MEEKKISEKESIAVITEMIGRTKDRYMLGDGNILLMWGYVTVGVSALIWVLLALTHNPVWNWLWFLIWIIGGTATPIMVRRRSIQKGSKSYSDRLTSSIWSVVGWSAIVATFMCLGFLLVKGACAWSMMFAIALIFVPFAEIAQGIIINERSFIWGGAIGLLSGIFTMCCIAAQIKLGVSWFIPIFILSFVCMMIIPGYTINHKARKER